MQICQGKLDINSEREQGMRMKGEAAAAVIVFSGLLLHQSDLHQDMELGHGPGLKMKEEGRNAT